MSGLPRTGTVYFIQVGRFVKIGYASNPHKRIEQIERGDRNLAYPEGYDSTAPVQLILLVPFCRIRDERNMHLLFGNHWVAGEWFHWSPAFERQMRGMSFVTHAVRRNWLAEHRRIHGGVSHTKEERWGMQTADLLAHLAEWRTSHEMPAAA